MKEARAPHFELYKFDAHFPLESQEDVARPQHLRGIHSGVPEQTKGIELQGLHPFLVLRSLGNW